VLCCFTMACFSLYLMQSFLYHFVKKLLSAARELPPALDSAPWVNVFDFLRILKVSVRLQRALLYRCIFPCGVLISPSPHCSVDLLPLHTHAGSVDVART